MTRPDIPAKRLPASIVALAVWALSCCALNQAQAGSLQEEQQCLALTLYFEARGEGRDGMVAVGWIVLNRIRTPGFPGTPCAVIRQGGETPPCQFSWWCDGKSDRPREARSWQSAQLIAAELLRDPPPDPTAGALYFHHSGARAPWKRERTVEIGRHVFYR